MSFLEGLSINRRAVFAEFIGTFALVLVGAGAVVMESHTGMSHLGIPDGKVGLAGVALAHGLILMAMIYGLGSISGGHFNPAVSLAFWMRRDQSADLFFAYVLAQVMGAIVAAMLLGGLFPDEIQLASLGTPSLAPKISFLKGSLIEAAITFVFVTTVMFVTREGNKGGWAFSGIAIGGCLVALILFAGPITGAAVNPARYLGPAVVAGQLREILVYLAGPLLGGAMAAMVFNLVLGGEAKAPESATDEAPIAESEPAVKKDDPAGEPSSAAARLSAAREAFAEGRTEEAAQALLPLLASFETLDPDIKNSVRTLSVVVDHSLGRYEPFRAFDSAIHPRIAPAEAT
jgi:MIP family channel proteins